MRPSDVEEMLEEGRESLATKLERAAETSGARAIKLENLERSTAMRHGGYL